MAFQPVEPGLNFAKREIERLRWWKERRIFEKTLEARKDGERFVFFEGPPTANGRPHPGHILTRVIKDIYPRYKTMCGYYVRRKAGWDTHGLPVEVEVSKTLGLHAKAEIERYGIEPFIHQCMESVFRYTQEWERMTERLGFWVHLDEAYVTYHQSYVESVWWALKTLFERDLLFESYKIVWWWAQGGTALSAGEVGQGYREVADPSVFVRCPLRDREDLALLVWTTTPWTLPSNQFVAVHPEVTYAIVAFEGEDRHLVIARELVEEIAKKVGRTFEIVGTLPGAEMVGWRYLPPFDHFYARMGEQKGRLRDGGEEGIAWRVVAADFVTTDAGSGLVHQAPAFGEVDFEVLKRETARFVEGEGPPLLCPVAPDGTFTTEIPELTGKWVKDADPELIESLRNRGLLFHVEEYVHDYPFCWRAENDPLIQYPRKSWFIRTTAFKEEMLANNRAIRWYPAHIQTGRFGNFLESNVDWALSRERFWGTPLPIWVCEETGYREAIGSYAELLAKPDVTGLEMWEAAKAKHPDLSEHLKVHKPYIDAITYASPKAPGKRMRRVPEVIDCWFDSGAMPFAQWGWPHRGEEDFRDQFPADFISEAIDQTRGWFYSLLAISTLLFSERAAGASSCTRPYPHPYKNCIVLGHVLGEDGQKMSKSRGNVCDPWDVFDHQGADALRWYFLSAAPPWNPRPFSERLVAEVVQKFLGTFKNTYAFFVLYANIDGFDPARDRCDRPPETLPLHLRHLDRWLLSEFHRLIRTVREEMEDFDATRATRAIEAFLEDLSNWWLRRSRNRFWRGELTVEKRWAYTLLYDVLEGLVRLCAPFVPFITEDIYQNLVRSVYPDAPESVHLATYPEHDADRIDDALARKMTLLRQIVGLGRSARNTSKIKNRQPLARLVVGGVEEEADFRELLPLLQEELNVKTVTTGGKREAFLSYAIKPNFKALGASAHGRHIPRIKEALAHLEDPTESARRLQGGEILSIEIDGETVPLSADLVEIVPHPKPGWVVAEEGGRFVALDTEITEELRLEGYAAELINKIQFMRKNANFEVTDRIRLYYSENDTLERVFAVHGAHIEAETLAVTTRKGIPQDEEGVNVKTWRVNDLTVTLGVERVG